VLEAQEGAGMVLGAGLLLLAVEEQLGAMRCGEARLLHLGATHHGLPATCALRLALLEARAPEKERRREEQKPAGSGPSIGQQRYELVLRLLHAWRPETLVDLGCGDGTLLRRLLEADGADGAEGHAVPSRMLGVDPSARALRTAVTKLRRTIERRRIARDGSGAAGGGGAAGSGYGLSAKVVAALPPLPSIALQCGSLETVQAVRADAVVAVEVIEHLDPEPLARFGEVLLGGCRPAHALVSTPNLEYNAVWHPTLPASALPLRNADHRFEWTREQMRGWAEPLARAHGYDVRFVGIGGDFDEAPGPGPVSQVAIFERRGDADTSAPGADTTTALPAAWPDCVAGAVTLTGM
jgi:SAM-dependent methyltransferase